MRAVRALAVAALLVVVAGCGSAAVLTAPPSPSVAPGPGSAAPSPATGSTAASPSTASPAAASADPSPAIPIDPTLLEVLPATVGGLDRQRDPSIDASAFADPDVANVATAGATALYIDPSSGEFAYVAVVRLKPGGISDAQFRAWRDSFDSGACSQAGGVSGHAEATIGGRLTYIGTCAGGVTTYHTLIADPALLVSASSVGEHRLGEQVIADLAP